MAIKKSQIYSTLWNACDALRGSMDASQYKDYVLILLFVKYLSDKATDPETMFEVPDGCRFSDFVALKGSDGIGEAINKKLEAIKSANIEMLGKLALPNFNDPAKLRELRLIVIPGKVFQQRARHHKQLALFAQRHNLIGLRRVVD